MRKTTEYKAEDRLTVDIEGLMAMLSCGEVTAKKIAYYAEARVIIGRRVLYNVDKIKKYIDAMGIGETRRKALMRKFKSLENIRDASLEELTETESMNAGSAQQVYDFFHVSNSK